MENQQKEKREEKRWPNLALFKEANGWDEFIAGWDPEKIGVRVAIGMLHDGFFGTFFMDPDRRLQRADWYLNCANRKYWSLHSKIASKAHKMLMKKAFNDISIGISCQNYSDETLLFLIKILKKFTSHFSDPFFKPKQGHHRKNIVKVLIQIYKFLQDKSDMIVPTEDSERIKSNTISALVACEFYKEIVKNNIFEAMDMLTKKAFEEERSAAPLTSYNSLIKFREEVESWEAENVIKILFGSDINVRSAKEAWILLLWLKKNAPKKEEEKPD